MSSKQLTGAGASIVEAIQETANQLGRLPSKEEYAASDAAKRVPLWRVMAFFHSFDKAAAHVKDPQVPAILSDERARMLIGKWALHFRELPLKSLWVDSIRAGAKLPSWDDTLTATGLDKDGVMDVAHAALAAAGYRPEKPGSPTCRRYIKGVAKQTTIKVQAAPAKRASAKRVSSCDDHLVRAELAAEAAARRAAGVRQGRLQTAADRAQSQMWATS